MKDYIVRATAADGYIRAFAANTTAMVDNARKIHGLSPVASAALGRTMTATTMMAIDLKDDNAEVSTIIKGGGPIGNIVVVAVSSGRIKGYVSNPKLDLPLKPNGKLDVSSAVGKNGTITVIKDYKLKEPYIGQTKLVSGEIAEDITYYFAVSEQKPSAVILGVLVDKDFSIDGAGGIILQPMPGAPDEVIDHIENKISSVGSISHRIAEGQKPEDILWDMLGDYGLKINDKVYPYFECDCNKKRLESVLISLGKDELEDMIEKDGMAELTCHYCNNKYVFTKDELEILLKQALDK